MKISNSRFLTVGNRDDLTKDFPAFLQKTNAEQSGADGNFSKMPQAMFSFPEVSLKAALSAFSVDSCQIGISAFFF